MAIFNSYISFTRGCVKTCDAPHHPTGILVKGLEEAQQRSVHRAVRRLGPLDEPWTEMAPQKNHETSGISWGIMGYLTRKN